MIEEYVVKHYEHVSQKPFEELIRGFEEAVGNGDDGKFLNGMKAISNEKDWEALCKAYFGAAGFLRVLTFDHGHWLKFYGVDAKAKQYTYGSPLLAYTMVKHDIGVTFQVPFRVLFYEGKAGESRIAYDLPSSLMSRLHNAAVDTEAQRIDNKVIDFFTNLAGAAA